MSLTVNFLKNVIFTPVRKSLNITWACFHCGILVQYLIFPYALLDSCEFQALAVSLMEPMYDFDAFYRYLRTVNWTVNVTLITIIVLIKEDATI